MSSRAAWIAAYRKPLDPLVLSLATAALRAARSRQIEGHQSVFNGLLAFCHRPGLLPGVLEVFPIRSDPRVAGNAVSPLLVPGRTGGRDHASEPRRCRPRLRCWTSPSAHLVGGALLASAPGLRPHPVQRNATKASICIRAHESESIEVLITPNQPEVLSLERRPVLTINRNGVHVRRIS